MVLQGRAARPVLAAGGGRVLAVLSAGVYLQSTAGVCCVGPRDLGAGPLNVLFAGAPVGFPRALSPDDPWSVHNGGVCIGRALRLTPAAARHWWPAAPRHTAASLGEGVAALAAWLAAHRCPGSPLGAVSPGARDGTPRRSGLGAAGDRAIATLDAWLRADAGACPAGVAVPPGVVDLLGRGPGLTPSGDDLLAGVLVALRGLGAPVAADRLAAVVMAEAPSRTSAIGAAHLGAAAQGAWLAPLHRVLAAVAGGRARQLPAAVRALEAVGQRSGHDALAGLWLAARALWSREGAGAQAQGP